ncbi:MAG: RNA polymerase sigma factor [Vicinamibacterales bacterium]
MRQDTTDQALVTRMRGGDANAVAELSVRYGARIQQLAMRYVKNREDAEEVAQDVLLKVSRKIDAFRGDSALSSWIYRITFNTAMSRLRRMRHLRPIEAASADTLPVDDAGAPRVAPDPADWSSLADDEVMRAELRARLVQALRTLPAVYRVPVLLRDIHGLSTEEASAVLRIKPQTLKSRLHRGRLILRERLSDFATGLSLHRH